MAALCAAAKLPVSVLGHSSGESTETPASSRKVLDSGTEVQIA